jgi:hypothetical protein
MTGALLLSTLAVLAGVPRLRVLFSEVPEAHFLLVVPAGRKEKRALAERGLQWCVQFVNRSAISQGK